MRNALRVSALLALLASLAVPASAGDGDTPITDPDLLERFGFSRDARNVYVSAGVDLTRPTGPSTPKEFGTMYPTFTTVPGNQHHPRASSTYEVQVGGGDIYLVSGDIFYDGLLEMPEGASLNAIDIWGFDDVPQNLQFTVIRTCQAGAGNPSSTILRTDDSGLASGAFVTGGPLGPSTPVDNQDCFYFVRTRFNAASSLLRLNKVRAIWTRQISPAPAVATFPNDTPTTHPYFRFIEALAASGITAGCAPQSFCPNAAITRGEMAVFLAAALGLHWP
jgi:hypothetical protein